MTERLVITPRIDDLPIGQSIQFSADYFNEFGEMEDVPVEWSSSAPNFISINELGLATALGNGPALIIAKAGEGSDTLKINQGISNTSDVRTGSFQSVGNNYQSNGTVRLEKSGDGLRLVFGNDFSTSPGPSLYVLLANYTNPPFPVTPGGLAVSGSSAQITSNRLTKFSGEMTLAVPEGVGIDDYRYVVLYCTLGPVFGRAELSD